MPEAEPTPEPAAERPRPTPLAASKPGRRGAESIHPGSVMTPQLSLRKAPRQSRSQATVTAILDATARILLERGVAATSTNAVAALLAVRWMVAYLARHDLSLFGWWRLLAAAAVAGLLLSGVM